MYSHRGRRRRRCYTWMSRSRRLLFAFADFRCSISKTAANGGGEIRRGTETRPHSSSRWSAKNNSTYEQEFEKQQRFASFFFSCFPSITHGRTSARNTCREERREKLAEMPRCRHQHTPLGWRKHTHSFSRPGVRRTSRSSRRTSVVTNGGTDVSQGRSPAQLHLVRRARVCAPGDAGFGRRSPAWLRHQF